MTNKKDLLIAVLATFCLTATLFMIIPTRSSPGSNDYDAWSDINDDGSIDMADIAIAIDKFMTNGDTTKNVNVTNCPKSSDVTVWYGYSLDSSSVGSVVQHSDGYSKLHMLIGVSDVSSGETVLFWVFANLYNAAHSAYISLSAYTCTFNYTNTSTAVSIDVPSEEFFFWFAAVADTTCKVYLSYYLTWA
jgi:hypothetical protein